MKSRRPVGLTLVINNDEINDGNMNIVPTQEELDKLFAEMYYQRSQKINENMRLIAQRDADIVLTPVKDIQHDHKNEEINRHNPYSKPIRSTKCAKNKKELIKNRKNCKDQNLNNIFPSCKKSGYTLPCKDDFYNLDKDCAKQILSSYYSENSACYRNI
jgi:hypothetical protein